LRALAARQVRAHGSYGTRAVGVEHQHLQGIAHVVMVELIGAYPVHDDLGVGGDEEVQGGAVRTITLVGFGQRLGGYLQRAPVGLGDEAAGGVGLEAQQGLNFFCGGVCP
jgi:hypothetical protein